MSEQQVWYDEEKVAEAVLALLYLNLWYDGKPPLATCRAWKSLPWEALDRLYEQGYISNPRSKARSIAFTPEGLHRAREAFRRLFALPNADLPQEDCLEAHLYGVPEEERSAKILELTQAARSQKKHR